MIKKDEYIEEQFKHQSFVGLAIPIEACKPKNDLQFSIWALVCAGMRNSYLVLVIGRLVSELGHFDNSGTYLISDLRGNAVAESFDRQALEVQGLRL